MPPQHGGYFGILDHHSFSFCIAQIKHRGSVHIFPVSHEMQNVDSLAQCGIDRRQRAGAIQSHELDLRVARKRNLEHLELGVRVNGRESEVLGVDWTCDGDKNADRTLEDWAAGNPRACNVPGERSRFKRSHIERHASFADVAQKLPGDLVQLGSAFVDAQPNAPLRPLTARGGPCLFECIIGKEPLKHLLAILAGSGTSRQDGQIGRQNSTRELKVAVESNFNRIPGTVSFQDANFQIGVIQFPCPARASRISAIPNRVPNYGRARCIFVKMKRSAGHEFVDFAFDLGNRDGHKTFCLEFAIQFPKLAGLQSCPTSDSLGGCLSRFFVDGQSLGRNPAVGTLGHIHCGGQLLIGCVEPQ